MSLTSWKELQERGAHGVETGKVAAATGIVSCGFRSEDEVERGRGGGAAAGYPWCDIFVAQKACSRSLGPGSLSISHTHTRSQPA